MEGGSEPGCLASGRFKSTQPIVLSAAVEAEKNGGDRRKIGGDSGGEGKEREQR